jgi:MscS family membrane protein
MPKTSSRSVSPVLVLLLLLGIGRAAPAWAQAPPPAPSEAGAALPPEADASAPPEVAPDSPRASLQAYLDAGRAGEWKKAARHLVLPEGRLAEGPTLAGRLKAVLDRHVWFDLEKISPASDGNRDDGLSAGVERVAEIPVGDERTQPVYMVRRVDDGGRLWAFSPNTVRHIDHWYDQLEGRWMRERLIGAGLEPLLRGGPLGLLWWQWIALPLLVLGAWVVGRFLGGLTRKLLSRLFARTRTERDDKLLKRIGPPLTFAWGLAFFWAALPSLGLTAKVEGFFVGLETAGAVIVVFWALWRSVDLLTDLLVSSPWAETSPSARTLLKVGANIAKGIIAGAGAVALLSAFGYPVTTLLAGLGIGGLAFAFGAQKTVENLFGSIALAVDQPFRVGDFVKVEDFVGTVEDIGLRSTQFRTLDRTVITIPNGSLSGQRLETFAARDRMRLATTIGVEYGTSHAQMEQVLEGFERVLREHPKIWPDAVVVKFMAFGASSLDIEIMAWFQVPTWADFQRCRQEVLLGFMRVVEEAGTSFAFPTRTVHLVGESAPTKDGGRPGGPPSRPPSPSPPGPARPEDLPVAD